MTNISRKKNSIFFIQQKIDNNLSFFGEIKDSNMNRSQFLKAFFLPIIVVRAKFSLELTFNFTMEVG